MVKRRNVKRRRPRAVKRGGKRRRLQSMSIPVKGRKFVGQGLAAAAGAIKTYYAMGKGGNATFTKTINKKRKTYPVEADGTLTKSKRRFNMNKYSLSRIVHATTNRLVQRFQSISNFDTNVGAEWISNYSSGTNIALPMLIIDCGSMKQLLAQPSALLGPYWEGLTASAPIRFGAKVGTDPDGNRTSNFGFQNEETDTELVGYESEHPSAVLNWVNLRMNLYGQRKRATKFVVTVFQVVQDEVGIHEGPANNVDKRALFQYLERPFIYSNLQQDPAKKKTGIKILKEYQYNVDPMTSIDLNTTTGNIHEANIYVKINKRMDYMYNKGENQILGHAQEDGQDYSTYKGDTTAVHMYPRPKQNVYIAVRAFAPIRTTDALRSADDSPSIDIIVRRCMTLPT